MNKLILLLLCICSFITGMGQVQDSAPKPTASQLAWQDTEYYFFMHFGPNTFTGLEWGKGTEHAEVFDPKDLDCDQWCRIAKDAGAKAIIITAKHHDGFCLWPSKYSTHTVRESQWKDGKGDVLRELSDACKKYGLKFGVYLSPWDMNHPTYGTPQYNDVFVNMLEEIFANYGPIWELWWDGANGEGPDGKKQVYDFARFERVVRKLSPETIIFSDIGPDARWCGNERGFAGKTNWNTLDTAGFKRGSGGPATDTLNQGNMFGKHWIPAECDVSIRPGWFYHHKEDSLVKTPEELFQIYLKSVGRGANLLLNVPPDTRGLISDVDSASLMGFKKLREESFSKDSEKHAVTYMVKDGVKNITRKLNDDAAASFETIEKPAQYIETVLDLPAKINCIAIEEFLNEGQNCAAFKLFLLDQDEHIVKEVNGTTIGHKRILTFPETEIRYIRLAILQQKGPVRISGIQAYHIQPDLIEK